MKWQRIGRGSWIDGILWAGQPYESPALRVEVALRTSVGASLTLGGESTDLALHVGVGFASVHLALEGVFPASWHSAARAWSDRRAEQLNAARLLDARESGPVYGYQLDPFEGRSTGFDVFDGALHLRLWNSDGCWDHRDRSRLPWNGNGWTWRVRPLDVLLGADVYEADPESDRNETTSVVMPEGRYPANLREYRCRWNRRWWKGAWVWRTEIEVPDGVPFPGKGENGWDCDDDAVFGMTVTTGPRSASAEHQLALSVLADRHRRAGLDWIPEGGWPPHCRPPGSMAAK